MLLVDWIFFILADNKDNYKYIVSNEFKIRLDPTMDCGVMRPLVNLKIFYLRSIQNILMTCCQVSDRCPLGYLLAHLSRRFTIEFIGWDSSRRPSVCPCVRLFTISNMVISTTRKPIPTKFDLKHYWGGGKAALSFSGNLWFPWQPIAPIGL